MRIGVTKKSRYVGVCPTHRAILAVALTAAVLLDIRTTGATYTCCSEERRGTVCTLAGSGDPYSTDSPNASTAAFYWPVGVTLYPPQSIIVTGQREHRLRIIHHNGSVGTLAGGGPIGEPEGSYLDSDNPLAARFRTPVGVCVDKEGNILLCDTSNHRIRTVLRNGSVGTLAGSGENGYLDSSDSLRAKFYYPHGIASIVENSQRLIIIGGHSDHRVRVIYANRTVSTLAGSGGVGDACGYKDNANPLTARFCYPVGVATDLIGNVIVTDHWGGRIRKVWRGVGQGGVTTLVGCGPLGEIGGTSADSDTPLLASIFSPNRVAIDAAGNILVSAHYEHRIRMIFVNGTVRTLAGSGPSTNLSSDTPGGFVDNVPLLQARFNRPHHILIDRQGNVILADGLNHRLRMLCLAVPNPAASASNTLQVQPPSNTRSYDTPSLLHTSSAMSRSASASIPTATASQTRTPTVAVTTSTSTWRTATPTFPGLGTDAPSLVTQKDATVTTTAAALVAATASGGGVELQGAIVLGMMDCSNAYVRKVSDGSSRLVTLLYDQSAVMRVLGNLLVAAAALFVHCAVVVVVLLHGSSLTIGEAAAKCRFPGLSHRIFVLCFQGLLLESLRGVVQHSDDTSALGVSVCGLVVCVCVPALVAVQCASASREVAYSPYVVALTKYPRWLRALLLPRGWWSRRDDAARRWGSLFLFTAGPSRSTLFCLLPYVRPAAMSVAAVVTEIPCTGRMVFLLCVHALLVTGVLCLLPHRVGLAGFGSITMDTLVVCMIGMTLAPESEATSRGTAWLLSAMGIVSFVLVVLQALLLVLERGWVHHEESASAANGALNVPLKDVDGRDECSTSRPSCNPLEENLPTMNKHI